MLKFLLPRYIFKNLTDINVGIFSGADLIIFDIDNTLFFSETTETIIEVLDWFSKINNKYKCICVSNSRTIFKREKQISELLDCEVFLSRHKKPFKGLFKEIKKKYNLGSGKIFIVGDRVFTDILFGNLNKMTTVFVNPLGSKENILIKIIRKIESFILFLGSFR